MKYLEPYIEQLKQAGYKVTHQRLVILDYLLHSKDHPSAEAIYADLRQRYPTISLATVYNTLEMLAKVGLVIDLGAPGERRRFDGNMTDHSHYFCTSCGRVTDLHIPGAERTINKLTQELNLPITRYRLDFFGLCENCQTANGKATPGE